MKHIAKLITLIVCIQTAHITPAQLLKSDAAQAIQVGAVVGAGMGVLGIISEHMILNYAIANAQQNLHLINSVDGIEVTSIDLIGRGLFQKKRVTIENKMAFKAIIESELLVLEHIATEPALLRTSKTMIRYIFSGGFAGLVSSCIIGFCKANGINNLSDFNKEAPDSGKYRQNQEFIAAWEQFKTATFGKNTDGKIVLAAFISFFCTLCNLAEKPYRI